MGKNVSKKKINYGSMAEEAITPLENEPTATPTQEYEHTDTSTVTDTREQESTYTDTVTPTPTEPKKPKKNKHTGTSTPTPKYAPAHLPTMGNGERKTERLQLVVRPSTKSRLAKYARDHGTSSNEVVQRLLNELLDESGY